MAIALIAIPLLINEMGKDRFGLLTIIWIGVGYFSLFDLGLGRALTKKLSEHLGRGDNTNLSPLIWTALSLLTALGILGSILLLATTPILVSGLLQVPNELQPEAIAAFRILAAGIPIVIVTAGLIGILEAHQRFADVAAVRIPLGALTFAAPLVTLQFSPSIPWTTFALLLCRTAALFIYYYLASRTRPELRKPRSIEKKYIKPLLSYGGWLTITNVVGPLMTYMDRFFVSALLGLSAVAHYATPYEVLSRLQTIPQAVMGVMFPAMAAAHSGDQQRLVTLYANSSKATYWLMLPITTGAFLLAPEALLLWLGDEFKTAATPVAQWLAAGWMINTVARPASTLLQATGRPDLTAKTHLGELIPYIAILLLLTESYGIAGVAAAWTLRVLADTLILNSLVAYKYETLRPQALRACFSALSTGLGFTLLSTLESLEQRLLTLAFLTSIAIFMLWPTLKQLTSPLRASDL